MSNDVFILPEDLTDQEHYLLDEVRRARGGVERIPCGLAWRDYVAEGLVHRGLITCRLAGGKRHLRLAEELAPVRCPRGPAGSVMTGPCDHRWLEWRGHHDHENEGRQRCVRCRVFKGDEDAVEPGEPRQ